MLADPHRTPFASPSGRRDGPPKQPEMAEKQATAREVAAEAYCNRPATCYNNTLAQGRGSSQHQDA